MTSIKKKQKPSADVSETKEKLEISISNSNAGGSHDTYKSQLYQIQILILFALKGKFLKDFKLSSEVKDANPFDDLMIKFLNERNEKDVRLLQAKYKLNPEDITWDILFKGKLLNLPSYFDGLNKISSGFSDNILDVIIATNHKLANSEDGIIKLKSETSNCCIVLENMKEDDLCFGLAGKRYKISKREEFLENNKEMLREQFKQKKNKSTNEKISNFIEKFMIVTDLSEAELKKEIFSILGHDFNVKLSVGTIYDLFEKKFTKWFVNIKNDNVFDITKLENLYHDIRRDIFVKNSIGITKYLYNRTDNLEFRNEIPAIDSVNSDDYKIILRETNVGETFYATCNLLNYLKSTLKDDEFLMFSTANPSNLQESVNYFCQTDSFHYCVIEIRDVDEWKSPIVEAIYSARSFVETSQTNKNLIVLARGEVLTTLLMPTPTVPYKYLKLDEFKLSDLTEDSLVKLLDTKITFQNHSLLLKDILSDSNQELLLPSWNLKDVEHIKTIAGSVIQNEKFDSRVYVPRSFHREDKKLVIIPNDGSNHIDQDFMINLDNTERVVLISDVPGMGKSFLLNDLAVKIKEAYTNHWVILVNLNQFTEFFKAISKNSVDKIDESLVINFLGEKVLNLSNEPQIKLLSEFCRNVGNVQILFDGMDEIAPDYTEHVLKIIEKLLELKVNRIFISTRPEKFENRIEKYTDQIKYSMNKFNEEDQKMCLKNIWTFSDLDNREKGRLYELSESVIKNINESISDKDRNFTGIPLITRLVCEILQDESLEECNKFNNIFELYDIFVSKKIVIYLKGKNVIKSSSAGVGDIFKKSIIDFKNSYMKFALDEFLTNSERAIISDNIKIASEDGLYDRQSLCKCGIVTNFNSGCYFLHKTFAEYFICSYLKKNFNDANVAELILKFILVEDRFNFVRMLLNCCLKIDENNKDFIAEKSKILYGNYIREHWNDTQKGLRIAIQEQNDDLFQFLFEALINVDNKKDRKTVKKFLKSENSIVADYFRNIEDHSGLLEKIAAKLKTKFVKRLIISEYKNERFHENLLLVSTAKGSNAVKIIAWMKENTQNNKSFMRLVLQATDNFKRSLLHKIIYYYREENKEEKMKLFFSVLEAINDGKIDNSIYKNLIESSDKDEYKLLHLMERKNIEVAHKIKFNKLLNSSKHKLNK